MRATVKREGMMLIPADRAAEIVFDKLPAGRSVMAELWRPRSIEQHRLAFAFFTLLAEALNNGPGREQWTQDMVRRRLAVVTGHADLIPLPDKLARQWGSRLAVVPRSMSFSSMDADEFSRFLNDALDYVRDELAPWLVGTPQWGELAMLVGASAPEKEHGPSCLSPAKRWQDLEAGE